MAKRIEDSESTDGNQPVAAVQLNSSESGDNDERVLATEFVWSAIKDKFNYDTPSDGQNKLKELFGRADSVSLDSEGSKVVLESRRTDDYGTLRVTKAEFIQTGQGELSIKATEDWILDPSLYSGEVMEHRDQDVEDVVLVLVNGQSAQFIGNTGGVRFKIFDEVERDSKLWWWDGSFDVIRFEPSSS